MALQSPNSTAIMGHDDRALGTYIRQILQSDDRRVLIAAIGNLDYLNVVVASNSPESFIFNVDADPLQVAIHSREREFYTRQKRIDILDAYFTDKFERRRPQDRTSTALIEALAANAHVQQRESFGPRVVFSLQGP